MLSFFVRGLANLARKIGTRCWMVQNLALPGGTTYAGTYSNFPSGGSTFTLPVSSTTWGYSDTTKYIFNGWHIGQGDSNGNILTHAEADSYATDDEGNANGGNTGAYYSYPIAAAIEFGNQTEENYNTLYSICPRNWRLPSLVTNNGDTTPGGDFGALTEGYQTEFHNYSLSALNSTSFKLFQNAYTSGCDKSGCPYSDELSKRSYWWSSTVISSTRARALLPHNPYGMYTYDTARRQGNSIRCVVGGYVGRGQVNFTSVIFSCLSLHNCCKKYNTLATNTFQKTSYRSF